MNERPLEDTRSEREILEAALEFISVPEKWGKGGLHRRQTGAFCALGAVSKAITGWDDASLCYPDEALFPTKHRKLANAVCHELAQSIGDRYRGQSPKDLEKVFEFNDYEDTNYEDICDMFRETIKRLASK